MPDSQKITKKVSTKAQQGIAYFKKKQYLCNPFPLYGKHVDDHLDIEADLAYSEKLHGLATGHQHETNQLLKNIEQLQNDARMLLDENHELREANEAKDARIAELEARVAQLEARPISVAGDYVETQRINRYIADYKHPRRNKFKISPNDPILPLWDNTALSM